MSIGYAHVAQRASFGLVFIDLVSDFSCEIWQHWSSLLQGILRIALSPPLSVSLSLSDELSIAVSGSKRKSSP